MATSLNDIALIKVCGYAEEHAVVGLPELNAEHDFDNFWVYGWGENVEAGGGNYPDILHWVKTPFVDFGTCDGNYNG